MQTKSVYPSSAPITFWLVPFADAPMALCQQTPKSLCDFKLKAIFSVASPFEKRNEGDFAYESGRFIY